MAFSREFRILLAEIVLVLFIVGPVLAADYSDDFEDDTPPNTPTSTWYDFSVAGAGGTARVFDTTLAINDIVLRHQVSGGNPEMYLTSQSDEDWDFCESVDATPSTLRVAFRFLALPSAAALNIGLTVVGGVVNDGFNVQISSAGSPSFIIGQGAGVQTVGFTPSPTLVVNTWYNLTISTTGCAAGGIASAYLVEPDAQALAAGFTDEITSPVNRFQSRATAGMNAEIYYDNLEVVNVNAPPPQAVGALTTVAVTNLVGFDVDSTGTGLIARIDGGDDIQAYAPNTLTPLGAQRNVDCNGVGNQNEDMVAATGIGLVYIVCDSGSNNPAFFSIRSLSDGQLTFDDPDCDPDEFDSECLDDIDLRGGSDCADGADDFPDDLDLRELGDIASVPLDYSYITNNEFGFNADRAVAFAYSADNGFIGVMQYTAVAGVDDRCRTTRANFAGSQAEQIAVWQPNIDSEVVYFAAVDTGSQSKLYHYTPLDDACGGQCLQGTLVEAGSVGGTSGGTAVSCDDFYCLVATTSASDNLRLINLASGATVWSKTVGELDRGVALSVRGGLGDNPDGDADDFAVYLDGSSLTSYTANIVWASNGTAFGSIAAPTGTFVDLRLKDDGSLAWIATDDIIALYDIRAAFPDLIPTGCENPPCDEPGDEPGDGSVLFPVSGLVDSGTFPNAGLANMFMGVLMVAGMTVTLGFSPQVVTKGRAEFNSRLFLVLGVIGAILGFVLAIACGLFSTAVWVSVVVLAAIAVGVRIWLRSRGE